MSQKSRAISKSSYNPGSANHTIQEVRPASGGRVSNPPHYVNRREPVGDGLWITLTTRWLDHAPLYAVALVDETNADQRPPQEHRDLRAARRAANRLYARLTTGTER